MQEGELLTYRDTSLKLFGLDYTELVYVEAGSFMMGDNNSKYDEEKPEIAITFKEGYYIGKYLVTQELYKEVMGTEPSRFKGKHRPVERVSHDDICSGSGSFLSKLNLKIEEQYPDLMGNFVLPSEAQWEYAARGGKEWDSPKLEYSGSQNINDVAWYYENSNDQTMPAGLKQSNALGIYDMSGNVWEWCADWYGDYNGKPKDGSKFIKNGPFRVLRGGGFINFADFCRVTCRFNHAPNYCNGDIGFRLLFPQFMP